MTDNQTPSSHSLIGTDDTDTDTSNALTLASATSSPADAPKVLEIQDEDDLLAIFGLNEAPSELAQQLSATAEHKPKPKEKGIRAYSQGRAPDAIRVNPFSIHITPGFNCRDWRDPENIQHVIHLAHLMLSGYDITKPLEVRFDTAERKIFLIDGECRLRAARYAISHLKANFTTVPVIVSPVALNPYEAALKPINSNTGRRPPMLECAQQVRRLLLVHGKTVRDVSEDINVPVPTIKSWLRAYDAITPHGELHHAVARRMISVKAAIQLVEQANANPDEVRKLLHAAWVQATAPTIDHDPDIQIGGEELPTELQNTTPSAGDKNAPERQAHADGSEPVPEHLLLEEDPPQDELPPHDGKDETDVKPPLKKAEKPVSTGKPAPAAQQPKSIIDPAFEHITPDKDSSQIEITPDMATSVTAPPVKIRQRHVNKVVKNAGPETTEDFLRSLFITPDREENFTIGEKSAIGLQNVTLTLSDEQVEKLKDVLGLNTPNTDDDVQEHPSDFS